MCSAPRSTKIIIAGHGEVICDEVIPTEVIIAFILIEVHSTLCVGLLCVQHNGPQK